MISGWYVSAVGVTRHRLLNARHISGVYLGIPGRKDTRARYELGPARIRIASDKSCRQRETDSIFALILKTDAAIHGHMFAYFPRRTSGMLIPSQTNSRPLFQIFFEFVRSLPQLFSSKILLPCAVDVSHVTGGC